MESSGGKALQGRSTRENTTKFGGGGLGRWKRSGRCKVDARVDLRSGGKGGEVGLRQGDEEKPGFGQGGWGEKERRWIMNKI